MYVATLLSLFEVKVFDLELAGKNVANDNLVFTINESGHGQLDQRKSVDDLLLLGILGSGMLLAEYGLRQVQSFLLGKSAVVEETFSICKLLNLSTFFFTKPWDLHEWVLINITLLHQILRELDLGHDIFSGDFLGGASHSASHSEMQGLGEHDVHVRWECFQDLLEIFFDTLVF